MDSSGQHITHQVSWVERIKDKLLFLFRLTNNPVVKVYNGYGNKQTVLLFGHVLSLGPLSRKRYRQNFVTNLFALLRLFMVKQVSGAILKLQWQNEVFESKSEQDGFFKFEFKPRETIKPGWYPIQIELVSLPGVPYAVAKGEGMLFIPDENQFVCISDIDDTFLISHSSNLRKRLFVLFTQNAHTRKPFEGVVNHYRMLSKAGVHSEAVNPFFYVSSSEWNLYDYITEFSRKNELPKGVYLLNQMKTISQIVKTGQNNHSTKFMRIARVIEAFPAQKFILLGDDSQQDPMIYAAIIEHFPQKIESVYLRHVHLSNKEKVSAIVEKIRAAGIECCYFKHSTEAILHSKQIGLIEGMET